MRKRYFPASVRTANLPMAGRPPAAPVSRSLRRFITIAQQVGAECPSLPGKLAQTLSAIDPLGPAWSHWDQELVEKVSASRHVPTELITSLETSGHSWLDDLLTGLSGRTDEVVIFHAVRDTIRDLASTGRVILVGHGSVYITRDLPGGTHVRLIAPYELRVKNVAERFALSNREAERYMRRLDRQRAVFFHRFWPDRPLVAELFTAELNVAELDEQQLIGAIVAMSAAA